MEVNHEVVARKYRPATFHELTGQEHVSKTLQNSLERGRLHHAYLFSGVRGTGKTTTARILARGANCIPGITSEPCLKCASCTEIGTGASLDVIEIDAASNTGVDQVREVIINNISLAPARDRFKIFVIDEVHRLSGHAFDALLKTLEEPPAHVLFILATTEFHKVPETIVSRCQHFDFRQIPVEKIYNRLKEISTAESITITDSALREIARYGGGSLRDALSALDQVIAFSGSEISDDDVAGALGIVQFDVLEKAALAVADSKPAMVFEIVTELEARGSDLRDFSKQFMAMLRHLLFLKSGIKDADTLGVAEQDVAKLEGLASRFSEEELVRSFHLLAEIEKEIKDSPYPRFTLELGLVKLAGAIRLEPISEALSRLESLENRLSSASGGASTQSAPRFASAPISTPSPPPRAKAPTYESEPEDTGFEEVSEPLEIIEPPRASSRDFSSQVKLIVDELERQNRTALIVALRDASSIDVSNGSLIVTYAQDNVFTKRLRNSQTLFREVGEKVFKQPLNIEIRIKPGAESKPHGLVPSEARPGEEARSRRAELEERALKNPTVRLVKEGLRAEIIDVREKEREL